MTYNIHSQDRNNFFLPHGFQIPEAQTAPIENITSPEAPLPYYGHSANALLRSQARARGLTDGADLLNEVSPLPFPQAIAEMMQEKLFFLINDQPVALTFEEMLRAYAVVDASIHFENLLGALGNAWVHEASVMPMIFAQGSDVEVRILLNKFPEGQSNPLLHLLAKRYLMDAATFEYKYKGSRTKNSCQGFRALMQLPLEHVVAVVIPRKAGLPARFIDVAELLKNKKNKYLEEFCEAYLQKVYKGQLYDLLQKSSLSHLPTHMLPPFIQIDCYNAEHRHFTFKIVHGKLDPLFTCQGPFLDLMPWLEGKSLVFEGTAQSLHDINCQLIRLSHEPKGAHAYSQYWSLITKGHQGVNREDEQKIQKSVEDFSLEDICEALKRELKGDPDFNFAFLFNACQTLPEKDCSKIWNHFQNITPKTNTLLALRQAIFASGADSSLIQAIAELHAFRLLANSTERSPVKHLEGYVIRWHGLQLAFNPKKSLETLIQHFPKDLESSPLMHLFKLLPTLPLAPTSPLIIYRQELGFESNQLLEPLLKGISHPHLQAFCHDWLLFLVSFPLSEKVRSELVLHLPKILHAERDLTKRQNLANGLTSPLNFNLKLNGSGIETELVLALAKSTDSSLQRLALPVWEKCDPQQLSIPLPDLKREAPLLVLKMLKSGKLESEREALMREIARQKHEDSVFRFNILCEIVALLDRPSPFIFQLMEDFLANGDEDSAYNFALGCQKKNIFDEALFSAIKFVKFKEGSIGQVLNKLCRGWVEATEESLSRVTLRYYWQVIDTLDDEYKKKFCEPFFEQAWKMNLVKAQQLFQELTERNLVTEKMQKMVAKEPQHHLPNPPHKKPLQDLTGAEKQQQELPVEPPQALKNVEEMSEEERSNLFKKFLEAMNQPKAERQKFSEEVSRVLQKHYHVPLEGAQAVAQSSTVEKLLISLVEIKQESIAIELWFSLERKNQLKLISPLLGALKHIVDQKTFERLLDIHQKLPDPRLREALLSIQPKHTELLEEDRLEKVKALKLRDLASLKSLLQLPVKPDCSLIKNKVEPFLLNLWTLNKSQNESLELLEDLHGKYSQVDIAPCLKKFPVKTAAISDLVRYSQLLRMAPNREKFFVEAAETISRCIAPDHILAVIETLDHFGIRNLTLWSDALMTARTSPTPQIIERAWEAISHHPALDLEWERWKLLPLLANLDAKWLGEMRNALETAKNDQPLLEKLLELLLEKPERVTALFDAIARARSSINVKFLKLDFKFIKCAILTGDDAQIQTGLHKLQEWLEETNSEIDVVLKNVTEESFRALQWNTSAKPLLNDILVLYLYRFDNITLVREGILQDLKGKYQTGTVFFRQLVYAMKIREVLYFELDFGAQLIDLSIDYLMNCSPFTQFERTLFTAVCKYFCQNPLDKDSAFEAQEKLILECAEKWNSYHLEEYSKNTELADWHLLELALFGDDLVSGSAKETERSTLYTMWEKTMVQLIRKINISTSQGPIKMGPLPDRSLLDQYDGEPKKFNFENVIRIFLIFGYSLSKKGSRGYFQQLYNWAEACINRFGNDASFQAHLDVILGIMTNEEIKGDIEAKKERDQYLLKLVETVANGRCTLALNKIVDEYKLICETLGVQNDDPSFNAAMELINQQVLSIQTTIKK